MEKIILSRGKSWKTNRRQTIRFLNHGLGHQSPDIFNHGGTEDTERTGTRGWDLGFESSVRLMHYAHDNKLQFIDTKL